MLCWGRHILISNDELDGHVIILSGDDSDSEVVVIIDNEREGYEACVDSRRHWGPSTERLPKTER